LVAALLPGVEYNLPQEALVAVATLELSLLDSADQESHQQRRNLL
jgi:hypothetical protein